VSVRRKKRVVFVSISIVFFLTLVAACFFVRETPRYSLYRFKKALMERDAEGVLKYLDTESIVDNMIKDMSPENDKGNTQIKQKKEGPLRNITRDIIIQNLPSIKGQLQGQIKSFITSYNDQAVLNNLSKASVFGLNITRENNIALIRIRGRDNIVFKMAKTQESHWRIIALDLKEIMAFSSKSDK